MTPTPEDIVHFRLERAEQSLSEANLLAEAGAWNGCVNRLYYACFYAATALIARDGESSSKHTGVRSFLNQRYVRAGHIEPDLGKFYNVLFDLRLDGDYEDLTTFEEERVRPFMADTRRFLTRVAELLRAS